MPARDLMVVFGTTQRVLQAEREARRLGLDVDVAPAPRTVSSECGVVLEAAGSQAAELAAMLRTLALRPEAIYRTSGDVWLPTTLEAAPGAAVALTQGSRYGGCGAKLAKGELATILCSLPRLESPDLLVGIEYADDAGVVRVRPDLAVIHTVDFFPPVVDDPFSFGRIAAANALSDVYAMGGVPLAGMNLVSFPLDAFGKDVLKEILRGGLSALEEASAVLAGGHTIEGSELMYGMAVTGTVHPERIWRNGGARPGDLLVLTKPLGTGAITTAGMAAADHLTGAIRSMSALNRDAADGARQARPHAVTDVTGFGLAGHAAEMAEASGLRLEVVLSSLPLLPGAREAAEQGLLPAGTGKNRESLAAVLEMDERADPILADLALDPQTSGGLLVACDEAGALLLNRLLPRAVVVGRAVAGTPGSVRLVR